jgi:hypothetical protein
MASLRLSNFSEYVQGSDQMDLIEVRLGEAYAVPFTIKDNAVPPQPIDLTDWSFSVTLDSYTANFTYNGSLLTTVGNVTEQGTSSAITGLDVVNISASTGAAVLTIPVGATSIPANLVTADSDNTLLNVITITATWPSSVVGFDSVRKLLIGLIVRIS